MFLVVTTSNAAEYFSIANGNWTSRDTWSTSSGGGRVGMGVFPIAGDIVHIEGGDVVTLTANAACASIDFPTTNNSNSIVLNGFTLNVSGNILIPRAGGSSLNQINVGTGTLNAGSIDFPTTGNTVRHRILISTGTVMVSGNLSTSSNDVSARIEFTGAGLLRVGGDFFSNGGGSLIPSTGRVELNGTNQSFNAFSYYNLLFSTGGTKTFIGTTTITNALTINTNVNANLGTGLTHSAATLTLGANQVVPSSWGNTISPSLRKDDTFFTATTGIVNVSSSTCTNFNAGVPITSVSYNNQTRPSSGTGNYEDLTSPVLTSVVKGQSYALVVRGNTGGDQNAYYDAYFDWNNNGTFEASEYVKIGTIRNSVGTTADGKSASVYVTVPTGAFTGTIKVRVMSRTGNYNNNPCASLGNTGQIEDHSITLQDPCTGNLTPGNTLSTATTVCPYTPFTLSLQNTLQDGVTYTWQTSPDGTGSWSTASTPTTNFFGLETFDAANAQANLYGDAVLVGGQLQLTRAVNSLYGAYVIQKTPGVNYDAFNVNFDYQIPTTGGADGFSLSYASDVANDATGGEDGSGTGIIVQFDTYDNEGVQAGSRIRIKYAGNTIYNTAINEPVLRPTTGNTPVIIKVDARGRLSLTVNNSVVVADLALPGAYLLAVKSNWRFKFSARTGGSNDRHLIDNLLIRYVDPVGAGPTFTTTQTVKTFYRVMVTCGSTTNYSIPVMVDVTSATISPITATTCSGAASLTINPATITGNTVPTGTTYTWPVPVRTAGLSGGAASSGNPNSIATGVLTLNTGTTTPQTATYTVTPVSGTCTGVPFTVTVTVNPIQTTPSTSGKINVTCAELGKVTIGSLPSGSWQINQSGQASATINGTGTSYQVTGLVAGSYTFTVQTTTSCVSASSATVVIDDSPSATWNGLSWDGGAPDSTKRIIINSSNGTPFPASTPVVNGCSLTVNAGFTAIVSSGVTLVITNAVTTNGQLTFRSGSSLVQTTNVANSGQIDYERIATVRRYDATYWSSPVTNSSFRMNTLSPDTLFDKYLYYNPNASWVIDPYGTMVMETGKGYSIRAPQPFDADIAAPFTGVFKGVPNNGNINAVVVQDKYNLVGNPYPSAISAVALINGNTNLGTLYFWTHNSYPVYNPADSKYYYNNADFAAFNLTGSTETSSGETLNGQPFQGYIAAGQGFLAKPKTGTLSFTNTMRRNGSNTQFYKTDESAELEQNRLWLNLSNDYGAFKQALIGYIEGATNSFDINYDANTLGSNTSADFYSINESNNMTIQGRALPFDNKEIIPLGYKASTAGDYTISIDHADGFFDKQEVYLEDLLKAKIVNLRTENYKFATEAGTFANRFNLRYTSKTLGTGEFEDLENSVVVSVKNKVVKITSSKETIKNVNIYNIGAQILYSKDNINLSELQISNLNSGSQVLLVKITLENGHTLTKKVVYSAL
ncbi:hypothetical protein GCM10022250_18970 [Flavobacterium chungbukense]|uniref:GEVED domain-containing protein n=2 Tax=Flavobacterium chungbukense TaxID=877464 RepID=A0ABP7Y2I3_9FLAO